MTNTTKARLELVKEYVWYDELNDNLHVTLFDEYQLAIWFMVDAPALRRACEQSDPPIGITSKCTFIGDL